MKKNEKDRFSIQLHTLILFICAGLTGAGLLTYFGINWYRLFPLLIQNLPTFIFLLITGYFLYSFKYQLLSIPISFNAFILYMANGVLKTEKVHGLELVFLFLFIYFLSQLLFYLAIRQLHRKRLEQFCMRLIMWTVLLLIFNLILWLLKIDHRNLSVVELLIFCIPISVHAAMKSGMLIVERVWQKRFGGFCQQILIVIIMDFIFMLFSVLISSNYDQMSQFDAAFFIIFLALVVSIFRLLTRIYFERTLFYSLCAYTRPGTLFPSNAFPAMHFFEKQEVADCTNPSIRYLCFFLWITTPGTQAKPPDKDQQPLFQVTPTAFTAIHPSAKQIKSIPDQYASLFTFEGNRVKPEIIVQCCFSRKNWNSLDVDLIFKVMQQKANKKVKETDKLILKESWFFLS